MATFTIDVLSGKAFLFTTNFSGSSGGTISTATNALKLGNQLPAYYLNTSSTINSIKILADPFQTPVFANPLNLDATTHKDFKCGLITGNTTINLNNASDGDAGMIEVIMDAVSGHTITLGAMFIKNVGGGSVATTANADNFIGWRKIVSDIVYSVSQV